MNPNDQNKLLYKLQNEEPSLTRDDVVEIVNSMLANLNTSSSLGSGYIKSQNFVSGVSGWFLSNDSAEFNVGVSVKSINIPDTTTASSFHVDTSGNAWWGANVATGYAGSNARILADGSAIFKNVQIGGTTVQYIISNSGIFSYGDGSDGTVTCDGSTSVAGMSLAGSTYTITRDVYYNNLTINTGITVKPEGFRIFVKDTLTLSGTAKIDGNGTTGNIGIAPTGGASISMSDGYLKAGPATGAGGNGINAGGGGITSGSNGVDALNSLGYSGASGGAGGKGTIGSSTTTGGTGGIATTSNVKLIANWHLATLLDISSTGSTLKFTIGGSAGGGGGGTGLGAGDNAGGGGGGGACGRMLAIYSKNIVIGASASITANGGDGGAGGTGGTQRGGGGGGGGGNGGIIVLCYNNITNNGSITASAGAGGVAGTNTGTPAFTPAVAGTAGSAGIIYQFQLSL